eukprot:SAG11_NODE_36344_length_262_cov_0.625767_1_plen_72_part_01
MYVLLPMTYIMFIETLYSAWPQISAVMDTFDCHFGDSLQNCGGTGEVYSFLAAGDAAPGLLPFQIFMLIMTI